MVTALKIDLLALYTAQIHSSSLADGLGSGQQACAVARYEHSAAASPLSSSQSYAVSTNTPPTTGPSLNFLGHLPGSVALEQSSAIAALVVRMPVTAATIAIRALLFKPEFSSVNVRLLVMEIRLVI